MRKPYVADDGDMLKSQFLRDTEWAMILCKIPTKEKTKGNLWNKPVKLPPAIASSIISLYLCESNNGSEQSM